MADPPPAKRETWVHAWRWPIVFLIFSISAVLIMREFSPTRLMEKGGKASREVMRTGVDLWKDLTKTEIELRVNEFVEGLPTMDEDMALVVTRMDMTKSLYAENTKVKWGIDLGTTKVLLSVPSRVHYAIDLTGEKPIHFEVDRGSRRFRAYFPDPEVLAVEIFDKEKKVIVDTGWGRLRSRSGEAMMERLEDRKYDAVREKAESAEMIAEVRERARPVLARFVAMYLQQGGAFGDSKGFSQIEIHFAGDDPEMPAPSFGESVFDVDLPEPVE